MAKSKHGRELYLFRHAETVMNTRPHLVGGRSNETPLTAEGEAQSRRLGQLLLEKGIVPAHVYASPAVRTIKTARLALGEMGLDIEPTIHDALQEMSQGAWEGQPRSEVYTEEVIQGIARLGKDFKLEGGESMNDVGRRMRTWITETLPLRLPLGDSETTFVFTHGGSIRFLASDLLDWSHTKSLETTINNASVSLLTHDDHEWEVAFLNRDAADL